MAASSIAAPTDPAPARAFDRRQEQILTTTAHVSSLDAETSILVSPSWARSRGATLNPREDRGYWASDKMMQRSVVSVVSVVSSSAGAESPSSEPAYPDVEQTTEPGAPT